MSGLAQCSRHRAVVSYMIPLIFFFPVRVLCRLSLRSKGKYDVFHRATLEDSWLSTPYCTDYLLLLKEKTFLIAFMTRG